MDHRVIDTTTSPLFYFIQANRLTIKYAAKSLYVHSYTVLLVFWTPGPSVTRLICKRPREESRQNDRHHRTSCKADTDPAAAREAVAYLATKIQQHSRT